MLTTVPRTACSRTASPACAPGDVRYNTTSKGSPSATVIARQQSRPSALSISNAAGPPVLPIHVKEHLIARGYRASSSNRYDCVPCNPRAWLASEIRYAGRMPTPWSFQKLFPHSIAQTQNAAPLECMRLQQLANAKAPICRVQITSAAARKLSADHPQVVQFHRHPRCHRRQRRQGSSIGAADIGPARSFPHSDWQRSGQMAATKTKARESQCCTAPARWGANADRQKRCAP